MGHIVLHRYHKEDEEKEANRFASEFLMPSDEVKPDLKRLDLASLAVLKKHWKVSMQTIIEKAYTLKAISKDQRQKLYIKMSQHGYRKNEPVEIPVETPRALGRILAIHHVNFRRSLEEIRRSLDLHEDEFLKYYGNLLPNIRLLNEWRKRISQVQMLPQALRIMSGKFFLW